MSSALFQPLLHDPLGWKQSTTTYNDTFKLRNYGSTSNKEKKPSLYGQQYQKQMRKEQQQMKLRQPNRYYSQSTDEEEPTPRIMLLKKNEPNREVPPGFYQLPRSKTLPVVSEDPPVFVAEFKKQPAANHREAPHGSTAAQRLPTAPATTRAASLDARRYPQEENEKYMADPIDDYYRHWLTYPTPPTPPRIIDIKERLGQLKVPSTLSRSVSASHALDDRQPASQSNEPQESAGTHRSKKQSGDQRHFLDFNLPETPPELRASRHRLEKHRYHPSLDNYPPRPDVYQEDTDDYSKPAYAPDSDDEQSPPHNQTTSTKEDPDGADEENKPTDNEPSSTMGQTYDVNGLPTEYIEALEISDAAQEDYYKNLKFNDEKRFENSMYRIPSTMSSSDLKHESFIAYRNQQQPTPPINTNSTRRNEFGTWARNSTDRERESAMKILNNVLNQPVVGYDIPKKNQVLFKRSPVSATGVRQLGRTRDHQRIPCDICEKQLIKHHIWSLSRSNSLTCPHQA